MLAEFQRKRQKATIQSARRIFTIGAVLFIPFVVHLWLSDRPSLVFTVEWLVVAAGAAAAWLIPDSQPRLGVAAMLVYYGLVAVFAMFQFGPNMGVGVLSFSWLMSMVALQPYRWLGPVIMMSFYALVGVLDIAGLVGHHWYMDMTVMDWLRSTALITVVAIGSTLAAGRIADEVAEAWEREAAAVAERTETERTLMQSQRLEAIGKLAGGVAHDFNNTLAVLVGGIEALRFTEQADKRQELLSHMDQAARGAVATTRQLLALSRQGSEPGGPCKPNAALEALIPNLRRLFPETIDISARLRDCPYVSLSNGALEQAVLNLCLNARDAMPHGGSLHIDCEPEGDRVKISVTDSGAGMNAGTQSQALEEFFTTKQAGTGLGLSMVSKTVKGAGGDIIIDSFDKGTTVSLLLPVGGVAGDVGDLPRAPAAPVSRGQKVLLVEDNDSVLKLFQLTLENGGYTVITARTVAEALSLMETHDADILVTDAVLPDGEPSRAIEAFRGDGRKPVLVVSGYIYSDELVAGLGQGDYRFLQKPFSGAQLLNTLAELTDANVSC